MGNKSYEIEAAKLCFSSDEINPNTTVNLETGLIALPEVKIDAAVCGAAPYGQKVVAGEGGLLVCFSQLIIPRLVPRFPLLHGNDELLPDRRVWHLNEDGGVVGDLLKGNRSSLRARFCNFQVL